MAGFNINDFVSNLGPSGVLQTNKFLVGMYSPLIMQNTSINGTSTSDVERLIQFRAESVKIPGVTLLTADVNRYGVGTLQAMPFTAQFTPNTISFISDRNGILYKYFYTWLNSIFDYSGTQLGGSNVINKNPSYRTEYKDNYVTDLHVYIYDNYGNQVQEIVMFKAFPKAVNDISLGWSNNNELLKVTVEFSYRDWSMVGVSSTLNSAQNIPTANIATWSSDIAFVNTTPTAVSSSNNPPPSNQ